jgi:regulator of PEP synthase PpsR (kinase-PPPase family)
MELAPDSTSNTINNNEHMPTMASPAILYTVEDETSCAVPTGRPATSMGLKLIFLISDATGVTAKAALTKSLAQFDTCDDDMGYGDGCDVQTRSFTFIRSEAVLKTIIDKAREKQACLMFTLADTNLRKCAIRSCEGEDTDTNKDGDGEDQDGAAGSRILPVPYVDLLGPSIDRLSTFLNKPPLGIPMLSAKRTKHASSHLGDSYYRRIEAVEFTLKADDGQSPWLLPEADVILVGVSRSGKTPLSIVLAQTMGLKVANVPLVMEVPPPKELLVLDDNNVSKIDPTRVFCLTIAPSELRRIRTTRLERRNVKGMEAKYNDSEQQGQQKSNYADRAYLLNDLKHARTLAASQGWTEIDVTGRAVEETASYIVQLLNDRSRQAGQQEELFSKHLS